MAKKIVKVKDEERAGISLDKVKDVIVDNKDNIVKAVEVAVDLLDSDKSSKKSKKTSSKKSKKSSKSNDLSDVIDLASKFLK